MRIRQAKTRRGDASDYCLLELSLPKSTPIDVNIAEEFIDNLGNQLANYQPAGRRLGHLNDHVSLEITARRGRICFYIWAPRYLRQNISTALNESYPEIRLTDKDDYSRRQREGITLGAELLPRKARAETDGTLASRLDVLQSFIAYLEKLETNDEELWLQLLIRPRTGSVVQGSAKLNYAARLFGRLAGSRPAAGPTRAKVNYPIGWDCKIRVIYQGRDQRTARLRFKLLDTIFNHFSTSRSAGMSLKNLSSSSDRQLEYHARFFIDKGQRLSAVEIASLFNPAYLPHGTAEAESTPHVIDAPADIPLSGSQSDKDVSLIGLTAVDGKQSVFGILREDRPRHVAIFGQAGMGKTSLMQLLILSDIYWDQGFAVFDPNGNLAQEIIGFIPKRRHPDVVYINLDDPDWPVSFNPMSSVDAKLKGRLEVELVSSLKRLFDEEWSASIEYILKEVVVCLLDYPDATILDIPKFLRDASFRREVISHSQVEGTRSFWQTDFESWSQDNGAEHTAAILARLGNLESDPLISQVLGQPVGSVDFDEIITERKIVVINLARGIIGDAKALAIGELFLARLMIAALKFADQSERRPYYVYLDDSHSLTNENFITALSEGKMLELNFTLASESPSLFTETVKRAIFDKVDSYFCFNLNHEDAADLERYFKPKFAIDDLAQQAPRNFAASIIVHNRKAAAFSAKSLNLPAMPEANRSGVIAASRSRYGQTRALLPASGAEIIKSVFRLASKGVAKDHVGHVAMISQKTTSTPKKSRSK